MTEPHKIWIEQCEASEGIEDDFGTQKALEYLVGEKFLNFLEAAETSKNFRAEIPAFVERIKTIFERWQLAQYLETARETEPFDPELIEPRDHPILGKEEIEFDAEEIEEMRKDDIRQCTRDLLLVERAREMVVGGGAMKQQKPDDRQQEQQPRRPACPACGGQLIEIRAKLQCSRCHTICETCCEGGRG